MPDAVFYEKRRLSLFGCNETVPCLWCLKPVSFAKSTLEHILPLSHGGGNDYANLDIACHRCNTSRSSVLWIARRPQLEKTCLPSRLIAAMRKLLFGEVPFYEKPRHVRVVARMSVKKQRKKQRKLLQATATTVCQAPGSASSAAASASSQVGNSIGS
jgi:hypothetical protein